MAGDKETVDAQPNDELQKVVHPSGFELTAYNGLEVQKDTIGHDSEGRPIIAPEKPDAGPGTITVIGNL